MMLAYRNAFIAALCLHIFLAMALFFEWHHERPVLVAGNQSADASPPKSTSLEEKAIQAVSVNSQEVMKTVNELKAERLRQQQAEALRQHQLEEKAVAAKRERLLEQQRLEKIKEEAAKEALAREKKRMEEQQHLKQLAEQKKREEEQLVVIKKQQEQLKQQQQAEAKKLAELKKKQALANAEALKMKQLKAEQAEEAARAEQAKKQEALAEEAARNAAKMARMAGEVNKYKALIIGAISRQWILPENADSSKSSQFRIRLAPNGVVLEVSLTRSSGDAILDRSAQAAIYKASPLPVPSDPTTFNLFRDISLTVRPESARG